MEINARKQDLYYILSQHKQGDICENLRTYYNLFFSCKLVQGNNNVCMIYVIIFIELIAKKFKEVQVFTNITCTKRGHSSEQTALILGCHLRYGI